MTIGPRVRLLLGTAAMGVVLAGAAHAQTAIIGGGSTLASPTYETAFGFYVNNNPSADFLDYYVPSGSGPAQAALINNTTNAAGSAAPPFDLAASDATLTDSTQLYGSTGWNTVGTGLSSAGLLVEVPTIGTPITVPYNLNGITGNGAFNLSDNDLCGIFSGKLTNWSQISDSGNSSLPNEGPITVAYRADGSGTSFLLTQHLARVCSTGASGNSNISFSATTTFANLFTTLPGNFKASTSNSGKLTGSPGEQAVINQTPGSVGYLSPDYTKIIAAPTNGSIAPYVANVDNVSPTPANTLSALSNGAPVTDKTVNPTQASFVVTDPNSFIPVEPVPPAGSYPIVGYTTILVAQCYADPNVAAAIKGFLAQFYTNATFKGLEQSNGFTPLPTSLANKIISTYLSASATNAINGHGAGACTTVAGR